MNARIIFELIVIRFTDLNKKQRQAVIGHRKSKGNPDWDRLCFCVGIYLSYRAVASQVLSARVSLTAVFGMGTGGPSP
jgi:hypothetical protein